MKKIYATAATITLLAIIIISIIIIATTLPSASNNSTQTTFNGVPVYSYSIIQTYPHDSSAFTQGLTFDNQGNLLEGTGLNGASSLRR